MGRQTGYSDVSITGDAQQWRCAAHSAMPVAAKSLTR